ncbi:MAG: FHA domain-containing protein [candidate division Zixibacteria bacterium]|nr:FHA domain-containing protein [candidate division Zixibacteria bacterium]
MPKIIVQKGPDIINTYNLPYRDEITIGSSTGCDVPIEDPSIASELAKLILKDDGFHLQLLTHIPPVFVTEERVEGDVRLEDGDTIRIEDYYLVLNVLPDEIPVKEEPAKEEKPETKEEKPEEKPEPPPESEPEPEPPKVEEKPPVEEKPEPPDEKPPEPSRPEEPEVEKPEPEPPPEPPKPEPPPEPPKPEKEEKPAAEDIHHMKTEEIRVDDFEEHPAKEAEKKPKPPAEKPEPPPKPVENEPEPPAPKAEPARPDEKPAAPPAAEEDDDSHKTKVLPTSGGAQPSEPKKHPAKRELDVYLLAISGPLKGQKFKLKKDANLIGRDRKQNDIVVRKDSSGELDKSISRQHARIEYSQGGFYLSDEGSQMRTKHNGRAISTDEKQALNIGDVVEICSIKENTVFRVAEEGRFDFSAPDLGKGIVTLIGKNLYLPYLLGAVGIVLIIIILILILK